jgi:copper homeostasis protein CutC
MAATPAAPPAATPRAPAAAAPRPRPVDAATDEAVASILNFQLPSSAAFLRPQLRVRLRKVARHRYAPSSDPFGSRAITTSAPTTTVTQPLGQPRARSGVSPAVAYYRSLQGGPPDPAPPLDPALAALTLGYPAKDAREALQCCRGGCRRLELFARSAGVAASALKAAREAGVQKIIMHAAKADGAWAPAAARADLALAKSLGASALCTDAFLADDPNEGAKLQTFVQAAKPVKVIIGRRAFDDVLERRPHMAERRDVLNRLGAAGVSAVYTSGGTGDAWTGRKTLKELLLIAKHVPGSPQIIVSGGVVLDRVKRLAAYTGATQFALDHADAPEPEPIDETEVEAREEVRPPMPAPDAPAPPVPAAWVAAALALAPPRPPATPAAAAALVPKAAALSISRWHAGTNDPDADHEKGDIAPRRFGGPAPPPPPKASPRDRSESSSPRSWAESPRTCRKGCGRSFGHPPARTAHEKTCRGLRGSSTRAGRENHYARTASRSNSPRPEPKPDGRRRGRPGAPLLAQPRQDAWPGLGYQEADAPVPAPKACLPFGGEAGGWPGLGDPEEELDVDAMDFDFGGDPLLPRSRAPSAGSWADLGAGRSPGRAPSGSWGDLGDGPAPFTLPPSPARPVPAPAASFVPPPVVPPPPEVASWPRDLSPRSEAAANDAAIARVIAEQGGYVGLPAIGPPPPSE